MKQITTQQAVEKLSTDLITDDGYYYSWQSNIAMAFKDELNKAGYAFPDLHKLSNEAAKRFLDLLTSNVKNLNKKD